MKKVFSVLLCLFIIPNIFSLEIDDESSQLKQHSFFLLPFGYDFIRLGELNIHSPALGVGYLRGEQDLPFDEVEHRIFGFALYQPVIFSSEIYLQVPNLNINTFLHQIDFLLDWRIRRHQLLFIFKSSADNPIAGGLSTIQSGAGWGYEVVRKPNVSLILGAALCVGDFGITLPNGEPLPFMPLPLIRFNVNTRWFASSFDFLSGPNLEITIAPKERIRFTADMRMDYYRSIYDLIYECTLWYRLFDENHRFGDFAGIGIGVKNESTAFTITGMSSTKKIDFEYQYNAIFGALDLSIINIQGGWIFDSRYMIDGKITDRPGRGFYVSVQGIIPIKYR